MNLFQREHELKIALGKLDKIKGRMERIKKNTTSPRMSISPALVERIKRKKEQEK